MTPDIFKQSKNLFLVFSPGCGGNHIANLLSMTPDFEPRYTHDSYYEDMIWNYNNYFGSVPKNRNGVVVAHFSDLENLQKKQLTEFESKIVNSKKPYIFCSHAVEYITMDKEIYLIKDRIICLFSKPTGANKLIYTRMREGAWYNGERDDEMFLTIPIPKLYEIDNFVKYSQIKKDKIFTINTDLLYTIEGYDYIYETFKINLGISLPEVCRMMHTQYIKYAQQVSNEG